MQKVGDMPKSKRKIGRPETHPVKKIIGFTKEQLAIVENWRAKQRPIPNLSEAIRQLMERGLEVIEAKEAKETKEARSRSKSEPRAPHPDL
jgi:hypothetical protein